MSREMGGGWDRDDVLVFVSVAVQFFMSTAMVLKALDRDLCRVPLLNRGS